MGYFWPCNAQGNFGVIRLTCHFRKDDYLWGPTLGECSRGTSTLECLETVGHSVHHTAFKALEYGPGPKYYGIINNNMMCFNTGPYGRENFKTPHLLQFWFFLHQHFSTFSLWQFSQMLLIEILAFQILKKIDIFLNKGPHWSENFNTLLLLQYSFYMLSVTVLTQVTYRNFEF